jgi:hypothetical protein
VTALRGTDKSIFCRIDCNATRRRAFAKQQHDLHCQVTLRRPLTEFVQSPSAQHVLERQQLQQRAVQGQRGHVDDGDAQRDGRCVAERGNATRPQCRSRARLRLVPTRARELRRSYCDWESGDGGQDLGLALEIAEFINSKKANTFVCTVVSGVCSSWRSDHEKQRWPA